MCPSICIFNSLGRPCLHRPRIDDPEYKRLAPTDASTVYRRVLEKTEAYLNEMEVPKPMIDSMVSISSSDILWVDDFAEGLGRPPSIAEWEDASCGSGSACKASACTCTARLLATHRDRLAPPTVQASLGVCSYLFARLCAPLN
jgi:hypothetical protein